MDRAKRTPGDARRAPARLTPEANGDNRELFSGRRVRASLAKSAAERAPRDEMAGAGFCSPP
jgi:hypothetical protein